MGTGGTSNAWWTGRPEIRVTRFIPHTPHPRQHAFLCLPREVDDIMLGHAEALYGGAARGGKSDALLMAALQYVDVPGYSALILRRESPELYGAEGFIERSLEWLLPTLGKAAWNSTRLTWTFPSGAKLRFGHMQREDDKHDFQGQRFQFVGFDELTHFTESQYRYLFSRLDRPAEGPLSEVPLRMRASSNPGGPGHEWVKRRFIEKRTDPDDREDTPVKARERAFIPARVKDNPSVDRDAYVQTLSYLEPEYRAQLLDGDWDARQPGDWYFDERHLNAAVELGRQYEAKLQQEALPGPYGGVVHLGIDWGTSTHCVLGWPLDSGGFFIAREFYDYGDEVSRKTPRMLALNEWEHPWGRAFFDAAGITSQQTFNVTRDRLLGMRGPAAKSIPFGAPAPRTAGAAKRSLKGLGCSYLRRLARRSHGIHVLGNLEVTERTEGATFISGPLPGHLAISPRCTELLRQLRAIERDPENPTDAWRKDDDQHGPDAAVALVAMTARNFRAPPSLPREVTAA